MQRRMVGMGAITSFGSSPLPLAWTDGVVDQRPLPAGEMLGRANGVNRAGVADLDGSGAVDTVDLLQRLAAWQPDSQRISMPTDDRAMSSGQRPESRTLPVWPVMIGSGSMSERCTTLDEAAAWMAERTDWPVRDWAGSYLAEEQSPEPIVPPRLPMMVADGEAISVLIQMETEREGEEGWTLLEALRRVLAPPLRAFFGEIAFPWHRPWRFQLVVRAFEREADIVAWGGTESIHGELTNADLVERLEELDAAYGGLEVLSSSAMGCHVRFSDPPSDPQPLFDRLKDLDPTNWGWIGSPNHRMPSNDQIREALGTGERVYLWWDE